MLKYIDTLFYRKHGSRHADQAIEAKEITFLVMCDDATLRQGNHIKRVKKPSVAAISIWISTFMVQHDSGAHYCNQKLDTGFGHNGCNLKNPQLSRSK